MPCTIWKFTTAVADSIELDLPAGARILDVAQKPGHQLVFWALVDPGVAEERRHFRVYGTGQPIGEDPGEHVASVSSPSSAFVWHVFEVPPSPPRS